MIALKPHASSARGSVEAEGFTLIEVLIALIILAIGVLGIAAMQMSAYRQLQTAHNFSTVTTLAAEIADRMLANDPNSLPRYAAPDGTPNCVGSASSCSFDDIADYDVNQWQARIDATGGGSLTSGTGEITNSGGGVYVITMRWDDDLSGSTGTVCDPNNPSPDNLDCYVLTVGF